MQTLDIEEICARIMDSIFHCLERIDNGLVLLEDPETKSLREIIAKSRDDLEEEIKGRTSELLQFDKFLRAEIEEHEQTEMALNKIRSQYEETNKRLRVAYSVMREWKDRLGARLQGDEKGILIDGNGLIIGVTERAIEYLGMRRKELLNSSIYSIMDTKSAEKLKKDIKTALTGVFRLTLLPNIGKTHSKEVEIKFIKIYPKTGRMLLLLIADSLPGFDTIGLEIGDILR